MGKLKIYLDNCCYNRPFDNQKDVIVHMETQAKMFIQSLITFNSIELVYSSISVKEIEDSPFEENRNSIFAFIEKNAKYYLDKDKDEAAISLTEEIMKTGVKLKDASHTACAIISKCDYFITVDKRLLNYSDSRIKMVNPIDFIKIWRNSNV